MEIRENAFKKNLNLEEFLREINGDLKVAEQELLKKKYPIRPIILVMGALRSGTTLTTQWLANTGQFGYPTNLLSRFYQAPIIGAKIQRLLLDQKYNFRNEIADFSNDISYASQNGKTKGALAPNEFWYFWRRFFPYDEFHDVDYIPDRELQKIFDRKNFVNELMGMADVFEKPLAMKGMIANYNISFLNEILEQVIFIHVRRDCYTNIASVLEARKRQLGDEKCWYSFRIPEMEKLLRYKDPAMQAAGQIYYINQAIEAALNQIPDDRKMELLYEEFCKNPKKYYDTICNKLERQGYKISGRYQGENHFEITRKEVSEEIRQGYAEFKKTL